MTVGVEGVGFYIQIVICDSLWVNVDNKPELSKLVKDVFIADERAR